MYAGAIGLQVLTYLVIDDPMPSFPVELYSGMMQILIALALFPLTVWQCALLCGERWIGLLRAWNGTWSKRRHALVVAAIVYVCFGLLGFGIEAIVGRDSAGLPEPVGLALLLLPTVASSVLSIVLAFAVFLRIRSEDLESAPFA